MPIMRILRRSLPGLAGVAFMLFILAFGIFGLYQAWAYQVIYGSSYKAQPIEFVADVIICAIIVMMFGPLLIALPFLALADARRYKRRASRPPLDNAICEPFDRERR
jgi:hypothetical protein